MHARNFHIYRADMDGEPVFANLLQAAERSDVRYETSKALKAIRDQHDRIGL